MDTDTTIADAALPAPVAPPLRLRAGAATATGHRRQHNEDAMAVTERACLVADGMGGHAAGEVAAAVAVAALVDRLATGELPEPDDIAVAISAANDAIHIEARRSGADGMGTTIVGAAVVHGPDHAAVAVFHVGDSRCYRLRDGVLDLVTRDHSLVQQLVDAGRLDPSAAASHPMGNVVTRALGVDPDVHADVAVLSRLPGRLLLCSDGLSDELPARTIGRVLAAVADPQAAADRLVELVLAGAARDNVTAVVVDTVVLDAGPPDTGSSGTVRLDTVTPLDHDGAAPTSHPTADRCA